MRVYANTMNNPWRLFDELMADLPHDVLNTVWRGATGRYPRVNVWERDDGLALEADVAGIDPKDLDVAVDANVLTIKGAKEQAGGERAEFRRSFRLPFELDSDAIKAHAKNGILTVTVPRKASEKRKIVVESL